MEYRTLFGVDITPRSTYRAEIAALREQLSSTQKSLADADRARCDCTRALHTFSNTLENIVTAFGERLAAIEKNQIKPKQNVARPNTHRKDTRNTTQAVPAVADKQGLYRRSRH